MRHALEYQITSNVNVTLAILETDTGVQVGFLRVFFVHLDFVYTCSVHGV